MRVKLGLVFRLVSYDQPRTSSCEGLYAPSEPAATDIAASATGARFIKRLRRERRGRSCSSGCLSRRRARCRRWRRATRGPPALRTQVREADRPVIGRRAAGRIPCPMWSPPGRSYATLLLHCSSTDARQRDRTSLPPSSNQRTNHLKRSALRRASPAGRLVEADKRPGRMTFAASLYWRNRATNRARDTTCFVVQWTADDPS